ncbi:MAG: hypothetical protein MJA27_29760 [Pseudanabaenales cyanobacterium]|nr:hypothetical protein [Pseudanabaenales cyanobacterium]
MLREGAIAPARQRLTAIGARSPLSLSFPPPAASAALLPQRQASHHD